MTNIQVQQAVEAGEIITINGRAYVPWTSIQDVMKQSQTQIDISQLESRLTGIETGISQLGDGISQLRERLKALAKPAEGIALLREEFARVESYLKNYPRPPVIDIDEDEDMEDDEEYADARFPKIEKLSEYVLPKSPEERITYSKRPSTMVKRVLLAYDPSTQLHGEICREALAGTQIGTIYMRDFMDEHLRDPEDEKAKRKAEIIAAIKSYWQKFDANSYTKFIKSEYAP
ncbi:MULTISPECIES: hypothetical protein [unclassified Coleofasciculus]|uniref:hypothetical protein n=1 Tax=unclassified Coleofasciculus TaxID=2692782 RepID=UPI00187E4884|nr:MULTISPECIES: hypothetical protein [unclassified Coleofasciculus]MBE9130197.1 hypothetical protein [Coleofasciculus sp. LEGE 07081]MBE9152432.1 hypothetical protein [Coleofasciculus sp. LEGE 07092]